MLPTTEASRLIALGGLLLLPAAIGAGIFAATWADADSLAAAPVCAHPDTSSSACLSLFSGTIVRRNPGNAKSPGTYTIAAAGTNTDVFPSCFLSHGACNTLTFETGTAVTTGWWKGGLVMLGPPGERPRILTDASPDSHLGIEAYLLGLIILPVSAFAAGILRRRRTATINELFHSALERTSDPPRPVDRGFVQRVAWTNYTFVLPASWALVYLIPAAGLGYGLIEPRLAPLLLAAAFVVAVALIAWVTDSYYSDLIRTGVFRRIEVRSVELGPRAVRPSISYPLLNGQTSSFVLDAGWKGHVKPADRIDALTTRKSGSIRRVISTPPDHE